MTDFRATGKNEFVDQYPYITYTDKEDDVNGDGGGSIPIASSDSVGGVMVGEGLDITEGGVLSASNNQMIVHIDGGGYTLRETYQEIKDFIDNNGYNVVAVLDSSGVGYEAKIYQLATTHITTYQEKIEFTRCSVYTDNNVNHLTISQLTIAPDNTVTRLSANS